MWRARLWGQYIGEARSIVCRSDGVLQTNINVYYQDLFFMYYGLELHNIGGAHQ